VSTGKAYLELQPHWLAAFSAGVVRPRTKQFRLRLLSSSCLLRSDLQATTVYGIPQDPNPDTQVLIFLSLSFFLLL
jgi:hypothetical protein